MADGLVDMAKHVLDGGGDEGEVEVPKARGARGRKRLRGAGELIATVDLAAWLGVEDDGETVDIVGVGPIPMSVARHIFGDALLRIVIRNGVDVLNVVHTGRTASAVQETAIIVLQEGRCGVTFCHRPPVEIDHREGFPKSGPVALAELLGLCGFHHDQKTNQGYTWRREADGTITWIPPP
jgi:hypothetical protein